MAATTSPRTGCLNALAGIFVFSTRDGPAAHRDRDGPVSMPSRAFLFFPPSVTDHAIQRLAESQCPRGHFCFFHSQVPSAPTLTMASQCPRGHFCFFHVFITGTGVVTVTSQCPRGHFCFFHAVAAPAVIVSSAASQCPRGHFCFFHRRTRGLADHRDGRSQCPRGHFCFFHMPIRTLENSIR